MCSLAFSRLPFDHLTFYYSHPILLFLIIHLFWLLDLPLNTIKYLNAFDSYTYTIHLKIAGFCFQLKLHKILKVTSIYSLKTIKTKSRNCIRSLSLAWRCFAWLHWLCVQQLYMLSNIWYRFKTKSKFSKEYISISHQIFKCTRLLCAIYFIDSV